MTSYSNALLSHCLQVNQMNEYALFICAFIKYDCIKANMNSYILLQTAAIFFPSSLYLKQGIDSVYVMVGFICKG